MSSFRVQCDGLVPLSEKCAACGRELGTACSTLRRVRNNSLLSNGNYAGISRRLGKYSDNITVYGERLAQMAGVLDLARQQYRGAEEKILGHDEGADTLKRAADLVAGFAATLAGAASGVGAETEGDDDSPWSFTFGTYKDDDKFGSGEQDKKKFKQIGKDEKFYKDPMCTIAEAKIEGKVEGSVLEGSVEGENDWAKGSAEAAFLTGEAHASAAAGLYMYEKDPETGETKRIFSPGVSAEIGASVAAVQAEAEGRIGLGKDKNMLGVYGNAEFKGLSGEAKAKVSAQRGEVYAGASAEADLVKVSGAAGVSILGTDLGVSGSLKVGVGAHAEVGFTDGKFKLDVGAAVGVGFDVGFEVDVGGTVDAICDFASSAWDTVTSWFSW